MTGIRKEHLKYTRLLEQSSHASHHKGDAIQLELPLAQSSSFGSDLQHSQRNGKQDLSIIKRKCLLLTGAGLLKGSPC